MGVFVVVAGGLYILYAFIGPNPLLRIVMRCLPVLPVAIWTIWFDRSRPLQRQSPLVRAGGRVLLLVVVMAFTVLLLGLALNWLYDPNRIA